MPPYGKNVFFAVKRLPVIILDVTCHFNLHRHYYLSVYIDTTQLFYLLNMTTLNNDTYNEAFFTQQSWVQNVCADKLIAFGEKVQANVKPPSMKNEFQSAVSAMKHDNSHPGLRNLLDGDRATKLRVELKAYLKPSKKRALPDDISQRFLELEAREESVKEENKRLKEAHAIQAEIAGITASLKALTDDNKALMKVVKTILFKYI